MEARVRRETTPAFYITSIITALERPRKSGQNAATILKPLAPNPSQLNPVFHMARHLAVWVAQ